MTTSSHLKLPPGVEVLGDVTPAFTGILTTDALAFVAKLHRAFAGRRAECLERRQERQAALDRDPRFPSRNQRDPRKRVDLRADPATAPPTAASKSLARLIARW